MAYTLTDQHRAWLNPLQPEGLFVSPMTLEEAQLALPSELRELQQTYLSFLDDPENPERILSWQSFTRHFLEWPDRFIMEGKGIPADLKLFLPEYGEEIAPTFMLLDKGDSSTALPLMLGMVVDATVDLNKIDSCDRHWPASPVRKLERLLREANVPAGLITNHKEIKLLYAPRGENVGILTFPVAPMAQVWGRPILGALQLLLGKTRLWGDVSERRLLALLEQSRKAQASVSTELAHQVLGALYELLRGFASANEQSRGELLDSIVATDGQAIYCGLLSVLMRLVFLLYAEDRGLMPATDVYEQAYSVHGLWKKLRDDAQRYPDTMDQRYGAWARLLALFRVVYEGCSHPSLSLPPRYGHLFNPERFPFLEGTESIPAVSDGTLAQVLDNLLILKGEKISYRSLDVEQIGSVYEAVMGFRFQVVCGLSVAIKPKKSHGAPPIVDLSALLAAKAVDRAKVFKQVSDRDLSGKAAEAVKTATSIDGLLSALEGLQEVRATPYPVPAGGWVLQPTDERRRSGSHYTPRSLTEPIVRKALEPIWKQLGEHPSPEAIKALKICDPAMGSGAFLVESCRQVAERLVDAWHYHKCVPSIPADEDELLYAKRVVAQRCLYGVDRNPMAVDLAKLSLWLTTLAKDHPFTFLDHSLRHGDSLVGLSRKQIVAFHWDTSAPPELIQKLIEDQLLKAFAIRKRIVESEETLSPATKAKQLILADEALSLVQLAGDLSLDAWFSAEKEVSRLKSRKELLVAFQFAADDSKKREALERLIFSRRNTEKSIISFHWEIEFPEVFSGDNPGFDVFVGNPPFAGKNTVAEGNHRLYPAWLKALHVESHGNADLVAHFFRRAFDLNRQGGAFGLIATNTIAQGDTRSSGLRYLCLHGAQIYRAVRRLKWPGEAAVIVSVVHVLKGDVNRINLARELDGHKVDSISAYLFHQGSSEDPKRLVANLNKSFQGSIVLGMGFTFDDNDKKGIASSLAEMKRLIEKNPRNAERIFPYLGGEEVNNSPKHENNRFVINFGEMSEEESMAWPDLMEIVERKVRPERNMQKDEGGKKQWWLHLRNRSELYSSITSIDYVLGINCGATPHMAFTFLPAKQLFANTLTIFPSSSLAFFCILQSRVHEIWARFFASSMKDDLRYTPSDCFETFPFPPHREDHPALEAASKVYYDFRADLMVRNDEGLTKTYNRFHDPDERSSDIIHLRELHAAMDKAVLDAYGFVDIDTTCGFYLDYEEDEDEDSGRKRKKPWRFRWSDEVRDDLLARLLDLNARQAAGQGDVPPGDSAADDGLEVTDDDEGD